MVQERYYLFKLVKGIISQEGRYSCHWIFHTEHHNSEMQSKNYLKYKNMAETKSWWETDITHTDRTKEPNQVRL